jgi:hypothetical protein
VKFWLLLARMAFWTLLRQWRRRDAVDARLDVYIAGRQQEGTWPSGDPLAGQTPRWL